MPERLLTARQAAERLGLKPKTLYDKAQRREIPCVRLFESVVRFRESDIDAMITEHFTPARKAG